jgi:hypothetical protein
LTALPAILLLAALPLRAQEDPVFRKAFYAECIKALGELDATQEQLAFVRKHAIDLEISTSTLKIPEDALGLYRDADKKMYLNEEMIAQGRRELGFRAAMEETDIPRILAWKVLPVLGHEIRHAITHEKIRRQLGFSFDSPSLEDEMISFVDTVRVLQEAIAKHPEYWSQRMILGIDGSNGDLLAAWRRNPTALKELVAPLYPEVPSVLAMSHEELLADIDERLRQCRKRRAAVQEDQDSILAIKSPTERASEQRQLDDTGADRITKVDLEQTERLRRVMTDPDKFKKLKAFFKSQLQALIRKTSQEPR